MSERLWLRWRESPFELSWCSAQKETCLYGVVVTKKWSE